MKVVKLVLFVIAAFAAWKLAQRFDLAGLLPGGGDKPRLAVLSVDCVSGAMSHAAVEVRNMGSAAIESPVGTVRFGSSKQTGHFVPATIAPEGRATLVVYPLTGNADDCELVSVADKDGRATELARRPKFTNPRDRVQVFP